MDLILLLKRNWDRTLYGDIQTVIEKLSQIMSEEESKTVHSTLPEYEKRGRIFYRLEDEKDFPATGLSKEELIEKRINNWKMTFF